MLVQVKEQERTQKENIVKQSFSKQIWATTLISLVSQVHTIFCIFTKNRVKNTFENLNKKMALYKQITWEPSPWSSLQTQNYNTFFDNDCQLYQYS